MNSLDVAIIDIGLGNIGSVARMVERAGGRTRVCKTPQELEGADKIILPGVGHFDYGMKALASHGFNSGLFNRCVESGARLLGICLGMQLLCRRSDEGVEKGLSLVDADVKRFSLEPGVVLPIPHMGWSIVRPVRDNKLVPPSEGECRYYFVHSFRVVPDRPDICIGETEYGGRFCAAFRQGRVWGVQFHPEKSHRFGMELMKRFVLMDENAE